jgi:hypothetical protein
VGSRRPPESPSVLDGGIVLPNEQISIDVDAVDNIIRGKGAPLIHFRAMKCPVGLEDPNDSRRTHDDHSGCSNGFVHIPIGRVTASLTSNPNKMQHQDFGWYDGSTIMATFPRFYDSDPDLQVLIRPYDRLYLEQEDILTGTWEVMARRKDGRPDRFEFPITKIEHLLDSNNKPYTAADYRITNGDIIWNDARGPELGQVYSCWYQYRPYWLVERLIHEIRLFPTHDFVSTDQVRMTRMGFGAVLQREYVHRTQPPDLQSTRDRNRQQLPPDIDEGSSV